MLGATVRTRHETTGRRDRRVTHRLDRSAGRRGTAAPTGTALARRTVRVIRFTEYGIPHIVARNYPDLGFGTGWAQAADQVCTLADGFVTVRGERSRFFGPDATTDGSLSSASDNLSSDLYFRGVRQTGTVERLLAEPAPLGPSREVRDLMSGFAAGYNAWLRQNRITDPACEGATWVRPIIRRRREAHTARPTPGPVPGAPRSWDRPHTWYAARRTAVPWVVPSGKVRGGGRATGGPVRCCCRTVRGNSFEAMRCSRSM